MSIVHLEAANIILTLNYWKKSLKNSHIVIWCDNFAVVNAFTHHKIRDVFLMACVRTIWLICAVYNIKLKVKHIRGIENTYADILSRLSFYNDKSASGCSQTIMICCQTSRYRGYNPLLNTSILLCLYFLGCGQLTWFTLPGIGQMCYWFETKDPENLPGGLPVVLGLYSVYECSGTLDGSHDVGTYGTEAQNNFDKSSVTVRNHISLLTHYFQIYNWPLEGLRSRQVLLFLKSLKYNGLVKPKIKGVLNITMLQELVKLTLQGSHASVLLPYI